MGALAAWTACGASTSSRIVRDPATVVTHETRMVGETVCWVEPKWMYPGPMDCHGYPPDAPGVPKCITKKSSEPLPNRTYWAPAYELDLDITKKTRSTEPLACCYRCVDELHDLGM